MHDLNPNYNLNTNYVCLICSVQCRKVQVPVSMLNVAYVPSCRMACLAIIEL